MLSERQPYSKLINLLELVTRIDSIDKIDSGKFCPIFELNNKICEVEESISWIITIKNWYDFREEQSLYKFCIRIKKKCLFH